MRMMRTTYKMPIYGQQKQEKSYVELPCYANYAVTERIRFYNTSESPPIELGKKTFHCIRRITLDRLEKCRGCLRDCGRGCFKLDSQYANMPELVDILIEVYKTRIKSCTPTGTIWYDDKQADKIRKLIFKGNTQNTELPL